MTRWEYFNIRVTTSTAGEARMNADFDKFGARGWELVTVTSDQYGNGFAFFKRQIKEV